MRLLPRKFNGGASGFDFNKYARLVFKPLLTIEEAECYTGLSRSLLYKLIKQGDVRYRKDGTKYYISRVDLDLLGADLRR